MMFDTRPHPADRLRASNRRGKSRSQMVSTLRRELILLLAPHGCCAICGKRVGNAKLEVDHVDGATWSRRALGSPARIVRYWEEYEAGIRLRAACRRCNAIDGTRRQREAKEKVS